jgi:hypothetical protein
VKSPSDNKSRRNKLQTSASFRRTPDGCENWRQSKALFYRQHAAAMAYDDFEFLLIELGEFGGAAASSDPSHLNFLHHLSIGDQGEQCCAADHAANQDLDEELRDRTRRRDVRSVPEKMLRRCRLRYA